MLHAADAAKCGLKKIMLRTGDTDVVVITVAKFHDLDLSKLWIAFGVGKHFRCITVHGIASTLGQEKSRALLAFHAFTGCNQTSSFKHIGKKTAWDAWSVYDEVTEVFQSLSASQSLPALNDALPILERYTVIMYDRTSTCTSVNTARKDLFTRKGSDIDNIPANALLQHAKRAVFQSGHCWGNCLKVSPQRRPPSEWGWVGDLTQTWEPLWSTIPHASQSCLELLRCGCKSEKGCAGRCKCVRAELPCTALCHCGGLCDRP